MREQKYIFCNIGWMAHYKGLDGTDDTIKGGGKFVKDNNRGHEVCNFLSCSNGYTYGHVETIRGDTDRLINITKIGAKADQDKIHNVTVVWTATNPNRGGRYVVGWYKDATVFSDRQSFKKPPSTQHKNDKISTFRIQAEYRNVVLLPIEKRDIKLGKPPGWMGHCPWWFPHNKYVKYPEIQAFMEHMENTIYEVSDDYSECSAIGFYKTLSTTEIKSLVDARIGQRQFRRALIQRRGKCAVSNCDVLKLLRASHIKPWKVSNNFERLDPDNGLLLLASLDAAFDSGLISFHDTGQIIISSALSTQNQKILNISKKTSIQEELTKAQILYLRYHHSECFCK